MKKKMIIAALAVALAVSTVAPRQSSMTVFASESNYREETPQEYEERTGYRLPDGWHYLLKDGCVILYEDGTPLIEEDETGEDSSEQETDTVVETETGTESGEFESTESQPAESDTEETETEEPGTGESEESDTSETEESEEETETNDSKPSEKPSGKPSEKKEELLNDQNSSEEYEASSQFIDIGDRIRYNVTVPIEGIPSFITQEMIVGALKCQDETGYPASVTIAQIIQESGFGRYGPGGAIGDGLSYLAWQYCNLFGVKGKGTAGTVNMETMEMTTDGESYTITAGFRAYHTYTEAIEDRSRILTEVYSDLISGVTDANTFAMRISGRWATGVNYGNSLIHIMQSYDLYRLDELTLQDFSSLIGRFADPCPGAVVTSTFGYRSFDNAFHKGIDLGTGSENIPTYAAEAGVVTYAGFSNSAGNYIIIDHGDGLVTKYMHHEELYVKKGQQVTKGQQIGLSGTTGNSTGNHLHFQVEENGVAVDPMLYLKDGGSGVISKRTTALVGMYIKTRQTDTCIGPLS